MYLDKVQIKNYFSIDDEGITIENLKSRNEIYFVGENGTGKTILLQAITLSIRGIEQIGTVIDVINQNKKKDKQQFTSEIEKNTDIFGYGVNRLSIRGLEVVDIKNEEVYISLFDTGRNLSNPVYWLQMIDLDEKYNKKNVRPSVAKNLINELLDRNIEIIFDGSDVIFNEKGTHLSFNQLSDGYKNSITLICDLLARLAYKQPSVENLFDYKAVVMVDEIDLFLHPKLQFDLIKKLTQKFPQIQWIFSTHNPIVLLGATEKSIAYKIYKEKGITKISEPIEIVDFTANSLITSNIGDLDRFYTSKIQNQFISDIDDTYKIIYDVVQKRRKNEPHISNDDLISLIENELDKISPDYYIINKNLLSEKTENTQQNNKLYFSIHKKHFFDRLKIKDRVFLYQDKTTGIYAFGQVCSNIKLENNLYSIELVDLQSFTNKEFSPEYLKKMTSFISFKNIFNQIDNNLGEKIWNDFIEQTQKCSNLKI